MRTSWHDHYEDCARTVRQWGERELRAWLTQNADPRLRKVLIDPVDRAAYTMAKMRAE